MDNIDNPTPAPASELSDLQQQIDSLRHVVVSALVLIIVLSGGINLYLLRQVSYSRKDLAVVQAQAGPVINEYLTNSGPQMDLFIGRLAEYSRVHPDFHDISLRYGLDKVTNSPLPASRALAPASTPAKK